MLNCAVIGATGYTGIELTKILLRHPFVRVSALTTRQDESIPVQKLIPTLSDDVNLEVRSYSSSELNKITDLAFLCLPHTQAVQTAEKLIEAGKYVIDLSADFRLKDVKTYEKWYGVKHGNKKLVKKAVYGLPELMRSEIKKAQLVANPGCYPTATALPLIPLMQAGIVEKDTIVVDAKSGVSGAGKKLSMGSHYCELAENFYAYRVGSHQHTPEIEQTLSYAAGKPVSIGFTTHLLPVKRGILSSIYFKKRKTVPAKKIGEILHKAYDNEPFVRVKKEGEFPQLKDVQYTNFCDIGYHVDAETNRVILISAIDNLLKGASGQAIQNMNVMYGFTETAGLD